MRAGRNTVTGGLFAASVLLGLAAGGTSPGPALTASYGPVPGASNESGTLGCSQLESLWQQAGGSPSEAFMAAEIATAESGGREYATDNNTNGTTDRGYWQVNSIWGALSTYDPIANAKAAVIISRNGTDWSPWVTFQTGAYQGKC